jgi:hypothetical protein
MRSPGIEERQQLSSAPMLHTPALQRLPGRILRLLEACYAKHGGAHRMTLGQWRDLEQQLKQTAI